MQLKQARCTTWCTPTSVRPRRFILRLLFLSTTEEGTWVTKLMTYRKKPEREGVDRMAKIATDDRTTSMNTRILGLTFTTEWRLVYFYRREWLLWTLWTWNNDEKYWEEGRLRRENRWHGWDQGEERNWTLGCTGRRTISVERASRRKRERSKIKSALDFETSSLLNNRTRVDICQEMISSFNPN